MNTLNKSLILFFSTIITLSSSWANDKDAYDEHCSGMMNITNKAALSVVDMKNKRIDELVSGMQAQDKEIYYPELKAHGHETDKVKKGLQTHIKAVASISKAVNTLDDRNCTVHIHENEIADFVLEDSSCYQDIAKNIEGVYGLKTYTYMMKSVCFDENQVVFTFFDPQEDEHRQVQIEEFSYPEYQ